MHNRIELQRKLEEILGSNQVFFQPPTNLKMVYPSIVYTRETINNNHANNDVYKQSFTYTITVMDKNPDSNIVMNLSKLSRIRHSRHYSADGIHHDIFSLTI